MWLNFVVLLKISKMGDDDSNTACLHIYHGGHFVCESFFLHVEGELTEAQMNPDYMGVENLEDVAVELVMQKRGLK